MMLMDETSEDRADALFHALSDRTRRDILRRVLAGEHSVSTLAAKYEMSFAAVQKHVATLQSAGLVTKTRRGREQLVSADVQTLRTARAALEALKSNVSKTTVRAVSCCRPCAALLCASSMTMPLSAAM